MNRFASSQFFRHPLAVAYRPDIDGLRAISVVLVVAFHLGVPYAGGGFVGVDVFFVISGFLITGVIFGEVERGTFSIARFYDRRARRILPMLIIIVLFSATAGYIMLYPGDYRAFGASALAALLGWSNIFFLHHTGYFDIPSQTMPLLHTWSLGVEEQFYLVWPTVLLVVSRQFGASRKKWQVLCLTIIIVSFIAAVIHGSHESKAAFYHLFTRAWELALGGLLIFLPPLSSWLPRRLIEVSPTLGLAAIVVATTTLSAEAPFPRFNALLPTIGAALIVYPQQTAVQAFLGATPLRFLGLISYSLYLWHWPLIAFWRVYNHDLPPTPSASLAIAVIAIALSALSWRFIEQPARRIKLTTPKVLGSAMAANAVALIVVALIVRGDGLPARLPPEADGLDGKDRMWEWPCPTKVALGLLPNSLMTPAPGCAYGADWDAARHHMLIWGDSLSQHLAPMLALAGQRTDTAIAEAYACAAIMQRGAPRNIAADLSPHYESWCDAARSQVLSVVSSSKLIDTVLLATSWSFLWPLLDAHSEEEGRDIMLAGLDELLNFIIASGKRPIVILDAPAAFGPDPVSCWLSIIGLPRRPCSVDPAWIDRATIVNQSTTHALIKQVVAQHPSAAVVDPMDFLCDTTRCRKFVSGEMIYRDAVHLRRNLRTSTVSILANGLRLDQALDPR
jgi:peptidoglycan/LPS O-acetylase OafA/YrhL